MLPPLTAAQCAEAVAEHPVLTARIVLFDVLVMNTDRHRGNLAFRSRKSGAAPFLVMYDHSHAVLGAPGHDPVPSRFKRTDWLGCDGKPQHRQCLLDHLTDSNALVAAIEAVEGLSDAAINEAVLMARAHGLAPGDANKAYNALRDRRKHIRRIVAINRVEFKGIQQWPLEVPDE